MKNFKNTINLYRKPLQWLVIALLIVMVMRTLFDKSYISDIEAYCPFGGIQSLGSYLINGSLACSMTTIQIGMGLALFFAVIIFSKLFCSFICPLGIYSEFLGKYGEKFKIRYSFKGYTDRVLRIFKYILLFITLYYTFLSSELFCKKFDPYYAVFSGFNTDVNFSYALVAILILTLGAIFISQAWCKYFCPLGALTNIFALALLIIPVVILYGLIIWISPLSFSWLVLLIILCGMGLIFEVFRMKLFGIPFFKITRQEAFCTSCKKCDKACPMGIKVSEATTVKHIDCHLCGDCLSVCPEKNALNINTKNKLRWVAPVATILIFCFALFFSAKYEIPTISEFWGDDEEIEKAEIYTIEGLKTVKCYGSSMSFALHLRDKDGILGVKTYVNTYKAVIYYNPEKISHDEVGLLIFTPSQNVIEKPVFTSNIAEWTVKVDRYFDEYDADYMLEKMKQNKGIYAYKIAYGEPAPATFYFNPELIDPNKIKEIIENKYIVLFDGENNYEQNTNFVIKDFSATYNNIKAHEFYHRFYPEFDYTFNQYDTYSNNDFDSSTVFLNELPDEKLNEKLLFLMSHISAHKAIVRLSTSYTNDGVLLICHFLKNKINNEEVLKWITSKELKIMYADGEFDTVINEIKYSENIAPVPSVVKN